MKKRTYLEEYRALAKDTVKKEYTKQYDFEKVSDEAEFEKMRDAFRTEFEDYAAKDALLSHEHSKIARKRLKDFLKTLDIEDIGELLEDILLEEQDILSEIFPSHHTSTAAEEAFDWFMDIPEATLHKVERELERIHRKTLANHYENEEINEAVKLKLYAVVARNKIGLSAAHLEDTFHIQLQRDEEFLSMETIWMMAKLQDRNGKFWAGLSLKEAPHLLPALLAYYRVEAERQIRLNDEKKASKYYDEAIRAYNLVMNWMSYIPSEVIDAYLTQEVDNLKYSLRYDSFFEKQKDKFDVVLENQVLSYYEEHKEYSIVEEYEKTPERLGNVLSKMEDRIKGIENQLYEQSEDIQKYGKRIKSTEVDIENIKETTNDLKAKLLQNLDQFNQLIETIQRDNDLSNAHKVEKIAKDYNDIFGQLSSKEYEKLKEDQSIRESYLTVASKAGVLVNLEMLPKEGHVSDFIDMARA